MTKRPVYEDFAEVQLTHPVEGRMPANARGVVMAAYADGLAYEVEFDTPYHVVLTLEEKDIRREGNA